MQFYKYNKLDNYYEIIGNKLGDIIAYMIYLYYTREKESISAIFFIFVIFSYLVIT